MGADIHVYAEKLVRKNWVVATEMIKNIDFDPENPRENEYCPLALEVDRNYDLFALLANVRNYSDITPISKPRGLPEDVCQEIQSEWQSWGKDAHSESWLYAHELLNYDWAQIIQKTGFVAPEAEYLFKKNPLGFPAKSFWPKDTTRSYARASRVGKRVEW